jgi:hypothetical protein
MIATDTCQRCQQTINNTRFALRIQADVPGGKVVDFSLCEDCVDSMRRWMERSARRADSDLDRAWDPLEAVNGPITGRGPGRRRAAFADALDRGEKWVHTRLILSALTVFAIFAGLIVLIGLWVTRR